ncbi:hypothetical protein [Nitrosomonas sp.]|uniref:hypothetical protein n=1 Tax=Nitrosomonas sp. TaxID=42353 RepID=UPI00283BB5E1|nr:hypothetical protein [Nitrosomonas sp.]MDR4513181.1 hypothetical protein [Nitrosomonas sp.]
MLVGESGLLVFALTLFAASGCNMHLGNTVSQVSDVEKKIDFNAIKWFAVRASAAYNSETEIKAAFRTPRALHGLVIRRYSIFLNSIQHGKSRLSVFAEPQI